MMMFIPLICVISLALAEPPVGDSYASARSGYDQDYDYDSQRSLSQEYGPPAARIFGNSRNTLSSEYGSPNRIASLKSGPSANYGPPNLRSDPSQEYGVPSVRNSASYSATSRDISNEYGVPSGHTDPSQIYGAPATRNSISHGSSFQNSNIARTSKNQYSVPEFQIPSEEYGVPTQRNFGTPSQKYGLPISRSSQNSLSQEYGAPSTRSGNFHQSHSTPRNVARSFARSNSGSFKGSAQFGSRLPSTSYGTPAAKNSGSYSQSIKALSQTYGAPSQQNLSTYEVSSSSDLSQEYGVPSNYAPNQKTNAIASSYSSAARTPSDSYGAPSARDIMPTEQYGIPDQYDKLSNQGYSYAKDALNEIINQEPANYDFAYKVNDYESGSDFGHTETRQDNRAEGTYFVVLPDGTKQTVEYEADERGFKPRISVEPVDLGHSGGYDDNAADLTRSGDGAY